MEAAYLVYSSYIAALGEKLRRAQQGMFPCQALLLFTLSIHGNTRPAQYGIAYKKSQCFLLFVLFTEAFTSLSECGMVKASTYVR